MRKSKQQLATTSRDRVFEFMKRFDARHLYTIDGPPDTDLDEIMAFAYEGGVAVVHTFEGVNGLWTLYTEPSVSGDLDELEAAMRLQIEERPHDGDEPLSGMWVMNALKNMIPRMSDETLKQASDLFDQALRDNKDATEVRIPVEGMTPDGFPEPGPAVGDLPSLTPEQMFPKSLALLRDAMDENPFHPESPEGRAWADGWRPDIQ